ncbi:hypothetical protein [Streptomyces meridianus]|uniref:Uncharacterized protein n=1 Tax=Streptomyces meridianus TaxID=2938945 RepID=A0ABT0XC95_9ACTN|nr:hypothetical protein [Streptomyces meridianus]MCM2580147.1 hypothetical protein [Streptomyces meridianus]
MPQFGPGGDERCDAEGAEDTGVVGDDGDPRLDRVLGVGWSEVGRRGTGEALGLGQGEFDRDYRIVLVRGG